MDGLIDLESWLNSESSNHTVNYARSITTVVDSIYDVTAQAFELGAVRGERHTQPHSQKDSKG